MGMALAVTTRPAFASSKHEQGKLCRKMEAYDTYKFFVVVVALKLLVMRGNARFLCIMCVIIAVAAFLLVDVFPHLIFFLA
jgi:hypothetical protein